MAGQQNWQNVQLAPVLLIVSKEEALVSRVVARLRAQAVRQAPDVEVSVLAAESLQPGQFAQMASPSLFALPRLVVLEGVQNASEVTQGEIVSYLASPEPDLWLVLTNDASVKAKKFLQTVAKAGAVRVEIPQLRKASDRKNLLVSEIRAQGGRIEPEAAQLIVDAIGENTGELLAAASQLAQDFPQVVTYAQARDYFGARLGANSFMIADEIIRGQGAQALVLLRRALAQGEAPLRIHSAIVNKFRGICKVSGPARLEPGQLGMSPWQADEARRAARLWSDARLAEAMQTLAQAEHEIKGAAKDPNYALESAVRRLAWPSRG